MGTGPIIKLFIFCFVEKQLGVNSSSLVGCAERKPFSRGQNFDRQGVAMKMSLGTKEAFFRRIMCDWLVCLSVWIVNQSKDDTTRLIMILWCVFAFIGNG